MDAVACASCRHDSAVGLERDRERGRRPLEVGGHLAAGPERLIQRTASRVPRECEGAVRRAPLLVAVADRDDLAVRLDGDVVSASIWPKSVMTFPARPKVVSRAPGLAASAEGPTSRAKPAQSTRNARIRGLGAIELPGTRAYPGRACACNESNERARLGFTAGSPRLAAYLNAFEPGHSSSACTDSVRARSGLRRDLRHFRPEAKMGPGGLEPPTNGL